MNGRERREWAEQFLEGEELSEADTVQLFMDGLDSAIIGIGGQYTKPLLVIYSYDLVIEALMEQGMDHEEASEYASFNILCAWVGEGTPIIIQTVPDESSELSDESSPTTETL